MLQFVLFNILLLFYTLLDFKTLCNITTLKNNSNSKQDNFFFKVHYKSSVVFEVSFLMCQSCFAAMRESSQHPLSTQTHYLKIVQKVAFNIASEASYVYILSGQKVIKNAKNSHFVRVFENLKLAVKQCYQTWQVNFKRTKMVWKFLNQMRHFELFSKSVNIPLNICCKLFQRSVYWDNKFQLFLKEFDWRCSQCI